MNQHNNQSHDEYIDYLHPFTSLFAKRYEGVSWVKPRNQAIGIIILGGLLSVAIFFGKKIVSLPNLEIIYVAIGILLGFMLFICSYYAAILHAQEKRKENPEYLSIKQRLSPGQRMRNGIFVFVFLLAASAVLFSSLPSIAGGVISVASALGLYSFCQRTPEEYRMYVEGELDPRDISNGDSPEQNPNPENKVTEKELEKMQEWVELLDKLPPAQREILQNDEEAMNSFIYHDEAKSKKRKRR